MRASDGGVDLETIAARVRESAGKAGAAMTEVERVLDQIRLDRLTRPARF